MSNSAENRRSPFGLNGRTTPGLYDGVAEALRTRHYGSRTEAYLHGIRRFLVFHSGTHLREMDVNRFMTHLAAGANVATPTHNRALAVVRFLYERVLERPLDPRRGSRAGPKAEATAGRVDRV